MVCYAVVNTWYIPIGSSMVFNNLLECDFKQRAAVPRSPGPLAGSMASSASQVLQALTPASQWAPFSHILQESCWFLCLETMRKGQKLMNKGQVSALKNDYLQSTWIVSASHILLNIYHIQMSHVYPQFNHAQFNHDAPLGRDTWLKTP